MNYMLNQITDKTEVNAHSEKNLTTFTIEVGLHTKDIDKILDIICKELMEGCSDTKRCIEAFNKERES
jgi:hypothetical protein